MKVVINTCFGGFGLSDAAYERLAEWGVPIQRHLEQLPEPLNDGEVIFDRDLTPADEDGFSAIYHKYKPHGLGGRYWDTWISGSRSHPLLVRVIEEMGKVADGQYAKLRIVEIPDGVEYEISEYDGSEHIAETHRTWR